jgi:hypothetical protein
MNYLKLAWIRYRGPLVLFLSGFVLWCFSLYEQIATPFFLGNNPATAATFNAICHAPGQDGYYLLPGSCAQALTDERAKGHAFVLGLILIVAAGFWAYKRLTRNESEDSS